MMKMNRILMAVVAVVVAVAAATVEATRCDPAAVQTTLNPADDPHGNTANLARQDHNANIYFSKSFVWLTGGPPSLIHGNCEGYYFFAIGNPRFSNKPADNNPDTLSAFYDLYLNRRLRADANGRFVEYIPDSDPGTEDHSVVVETDGSIRVRAAQFRDSANGEYKAAICYLGPSATSPLPSPLVCKTDNFRIDESQAPAPELTFGFSDQLTQNVDFAWTVDKDSSDDEGTIESSNPQQTINYNVVLTNTGNSVYNRQLTATLTVSNTGAAVSNVRIDSVLLDNAAGSYSGFNCVYPDDSVSLDDGTATPTTAEFQLTCTFGGTSTLEDGYLSGELDVSFVWGDPPLPQNHLGLMAVSGSRTFFLGFSFADAVTTTTDECVHFNDKLYNGNGDSLDCCNEKSPCSYPYSISFYTAPGTEQLIFNTAAMNGQSSTRRTVIRTGADLQVSKTAEGSYTRSFDWQLTKSVDRGVVKQVSGYVALTFNVKAEQLHCNDTNFQVSGDIVVKNNNTWQSVDASVSDVITDFKCQIDGGTTITVDASSQKTLSYTCTRPVPSNWPIAIDGQNEATATWDKIAYKTPSGDGSAQASFQFRPDAPSHKVGEVVVVTDNGDELFELTGNCFSPVSKETTYTRQILVPTTGCTQIVNNAAIYFADSGADNKHTVQTISYVCGPAPTVFGRTIGFWQNKNGQAIIKNNALTVCTSLATRLAGYAAFKDKFAAANSCATIATTTYNIVKDASAAGATMDKMLQAQMLASFLSVFFTETGHNSLLAPSPLGDMILDTSYVCRPSATGSCSDSSPAFDGTSTTVYHALEYCSGQRVGTPLVWYGANKAMQELAKNFWDSLNNNVLFIGNAAFNPAPQITDHTVLYACVSAGAAVALLGLAAYMRKRRSAPAVEAKQGEPEPLRLAPISSPASQSSGSTVDLQSVASLYASIEAETGSDTSSTSASAV